MKKISIIIILLFISNLSKAQWVNQFDAPSALFSVYAYNTLTAWTCGDSVYYTSNGGTNWLLRNTGLPQNFPKYSVHAIGPQTALLIINAGVDGKIFKTTNAGLSWNQKYTRNGVRLNDIEFMNSLTGFVYGNPINNFWFILKTTDGGETYDSTSVTRPPAISGGDMGFPNAMYVIDNPGDAYIWFGTNNFRVYYSKTSGIIWNNSQTLGNQFVISLTFINTLMGFAGGQQFAYRSTDGGINWIQQLGYPGAGPFFSFANAGGFIWYARGSGIFFSNNSGISFVPQHISPDNSPYMHLSFAFSPVDAMSTIVGWGVTSNGVISMYSLTSGIQQIGTTIPDDFKLEQNYPNPFNPITHFGFRIPDFGFVTIKIFDAIGKEITTIVNDNLQPGIYEAEWDASNYSSGIYFYNLTTENYSETKKMVLIR